jgi:hypothetical protein
MSTLLYQYMSIEHESGADTRVFQLRKKPMNLCVYDREELEHGVGTGVNATMMSETL